MDLNKQKRYDEMIKETLYVADEFSEKILRGAHDNELGIMAAILVASEHSNDNADNSPSMNGTSFSPRTPGLRIKNYRIDHGLSQVQMAKKLDISRPYMSEVESDKREMSTQTINKIVDKLGISMDEFLNY